jgi:hypothetical protein
MRAARVTDGFNCVLFQRIQYSACDVAKREKSAARLKIFRVVKV